jgi:DNA-binding transcriptional LysR family regulator
MQALEYPLSILARAVEYRNLSSASLHVGLSQPQISRLVGQLEAALGMELLNRRVKRKSSWTPQALQLAEIFKNNQRRLEHSIRSLQTNQRARQVHIGTLEGLADEAVHLSHLIFDKAGLALVFVDVFDRSELEAKFLSGDLDLILNTRFPSPTKPTYSKIIGYQALNDVRDESPYQLFSSFEFHLRHRPKPPARATKILVSNSLSVRRLWFEKYGGSGSLPSALVPKPRKDLDEVYLIGGEWLDPVIWRVLEEG